MSGTRAEQSAVWSDDALRFACQAPAVQGKKRCRMYGGASGTGAPKGNRNALKTGLHTQEMIEQRQVVSALLKRSRQMLKELK